MAGRSTRPTSHARSMRWRGARCDDELAAWVHGTGDLPLAPLLPKAGVSCEDGSAPPRRSAWACAVSESALTGVQVKGVLRGGAAERCGLSAGDELLAIDGWRIAPPRRCCSMWSAPGTTLRPAACARPACVAAATRSPAKPRRAVSLAGVEKPAREAAGAAPCMAAWLNPASTPRITQAGRCAAGHRGAASCTSWWRGAST